MAKLGVNIDHVATIREARRTFEPDPAWAAALAELGGADCITLHLREDRRHIQERDVRVLRETVAVKLNLEIACNPDVLHLALELRPDQVTLVPERREELTTEGGLDLRAHRETVASTICELREAGIEVSLFVDPERAPIEYAAELDADAVELHTGSYALATGTDRTSELVRLAAAGQLTRECDLVLHAGHGLNYQNVRPVASLDGMCELNIGHSIVARALMIGFRDAVREMKQLIS